MTKDSVPPKTEEVNRSSVSAGLQVVFVSGLTIRSTLPKPFEAVDKRAFSAPEPEGGGARTAPWPPLRCRIARDECGHNKRNRTQALPEGHNDLCTRDAGPWAQDPAPPTGGGGLAGSPTPAPDKEATQAGEVPKSQKGARTVCPSASRVSQPDFRPEGCPRSRGRS